jgi:thymidylate synthase (FAD)
MQAVYVNHYLTDDDVANFARQSFGKLAKHFTTEQNKKLIQFLARGMASGDWDKLLTEMVHDTVDEEEAHNLAVHLRKVPEHWVPFGHPQITFRMQAPVPIARQCFKHKIGMVESEESRRYITNEPQFFFPEFFRPAAANVKQGSADEPHSRSIYWTLVYKELCEKAKEEYLAAIEDGVCAEQARLFLPQGTEVNWVWTGSLYAFANFFNQRSDPHAQKEIQVLAEQVGETMTSLFPISWEALTNGFY